MWKYFKYEEFSCPCCGKNKTNYDLISKLDIAREIAGIPFVIKLGYICENYNRILNNLFELRLESHLAGNACKILCIENFSRFLIVSALLKVGFNQIGISEKFIHCEISKEKTPNSLWIWKK